MLAAIVVFPLLYLIPAEPVSVTISSWPLPICVVLIAGLLAGFVGLLLGTVVPPRQIGFIFSLVVIPVTAVLIALVEITAALAWLIIRSFIRRATD